jgi:hypothetical protein
MEVVRATFLFLSGFYVCHLPAISWTYRFGPWLVISCFSFGTLHGSLVGWLWVFDIWKVGSHHYKMDRRSLGGGDQFWIGHYRDRPGFFLVPFFPRLLFGHIAGEEQVLSFSSAGYPIQRTSFFLSLDSDC